ncbi:uncharacterized protein CTRU02_211270 [Colletotrichum truncatum]|uniref:Uncharacterized protein n=1 Tax=Colletotrichum truncatum TaxID=5467 RepID=A0ACC3YRB3_COLTU|nr:uncharacterized protein CTRU02_02048 [Colletotrichum truncatum]KAF6799177.1 hypothetical protein CTRU02_02048 [Colletotrichum truncatum]
MLFPTPSPRRGRSIQNLHTALLKHVAEDLREQLPKPSLCLVKQDNYDILVSELSAAARILSILKLKDVTLGRVTPNVDQENPHAFNCNPSTWQTVVQVYRDRELTGTATGVACAVKYYRAHGLEKLMALKMNAMQEYAASLSEEQIIHSTLNCGESS